MFGGADKRNVCGKVLLGQVQLAEGSLLNHIIANLSVCLVSFINANAHPPTLHSSPEDPG